jgi:hypothetical protein
LELVIERGLCADRTLARGGANDPNARAQDSDRAYEDECLVVRSYRHGRNLRRQLDSSRTVSLHPGSETCPVNYFFA